MSYMKLRSSDNEIIVVDVEVAKCSSILKAVAETHEGPGIIEEVVPVHVSTKVLTRIIVWAMHHQMNPTPTGGTPGQLSSFETKFLNMDQMMMLDLNMAAKKLDIKPLIELTSDGLLHLRNANVSGKLL